VASPDGSPTHRPPGLYRLARLFRRLSVVVLVVLLLYLATVGYSAFELARSTPHSGGYSAEFEPNDTVAVTGSLSVTNPGFYSISGFSLALRIQNASGVLLGVLREGPETLAAQATTTFPIALYLPIVPNGAASSLLETDQVLTVGVWANATYAYLFPVSIHFDQNKSWGAPFANFQAEAGTPTDVNGSVVVPLTISFSNDASFADAGNLTVVLRSSTSAPCGQVSFPLNVPSQTLYDQTQNVVLASGCSIAGGSAVTTFSGDGGTIVLPPEAIP
jgi:hypothetical protein